MRIDQSHEYAELHQPLTAAGVANHPGHEHVWRGWQCAAFSQATIGTGYCVEILVVPGTGPRHDRAERTQNQGKLVSIEYGGFHVAPRGRNVTGTFLISSGRANAIAAESGSIGATLAG